jgi:hypothetical protein
VFLVNVAFGCCLSEEFFESERECEREEKLSFGFIPLF